MKLFIDGELREASPSEPAALAPDDGAGLLEIVRVRRARIELEREHARRLLASAPALSLAPAPTLDADAVVAALRATVAANGGGDGLFEVRLRPGAPARLFVLPAPAPPFGPDQLAEGVALRTDSRRRDERAPASRLKSDARDAARRARRDAAAAGADEALFLNTRGRVACGAGCNVFLLTADGLATPPVEEGALPGIARAALFVAARRLGVPLREAPISVAELAAAPDLLLTASALGLVAVRSLDGRPLQRPVRGSLRKGLVPRLRLALHELCELPALPR